MSKYTEADLEKAERRLRVAGQKIGKGLTFSAGGPGAEIEYRDAFRDYRAIKNAIGGTEHIMGIKGQR